MRSHHAQLAECLQSVRCFPMIFRRILLWKHTIQQWWFIYSCSAFNIISFHRFRSLFHCYHGRKHDGRQAGSTMSGRQEWCWRGSLVLFILNHRQQEARKRNHLAWALETSKPDLEAKTLPKTKPHHLILPVLTKGFTSGDKASKYMSLWGHSHSNYHTGPWLGYIFTLKYFLEYLAVLNG